MDLHLGSGPAAPPIVGDLSESSDDPTWTEVERNFFAAAPPEEPEPLAGAPCFDALPRPPARRPRRVIIAGLRPSLVGAWRRTTLALGAACGHVQRAWRRTAAIVGSAGVSARRTAGKGAAGLVAAFSIRAVDRRRVAFAVMGTIIAAGLTAGVVAFRKGATIQDATAESGGPVTGPTVAETAPVAISASQAAPRPKLRSPAHVQAPRADVSNRRPHVPRRTVPASSSAQPPPVTAFMDRETYWARGAELAPDRSSGPFFRR
jgi:hypothetical protein